MRCRRWLARLISGRITRDNAGKIEEEEERGSKPPGTTEDRYSGLIPVEKWSRTRFAFVNAAYAATERAFRVQPVMASSFVALLATYCEPISATTGAHEDSSARAKEGGVARIGGNRAAKSALRAAPKISRLRLYWWFTCCLSDEYATLLSSAVG